MPDFTRVRDLLAEHEVFWAAVAQYNPRSSAMRWFMSTQWDPLYAQWIDLVTNHGLSDVDVNWLIEFLRRLNSVRSVATSHGIPVPHGDHGQLVASL